eukprot:SAG31_NODE_1136_length_9734_cov_4.139595_8_plen_380_part_00
MLFAHRLYCGDADESLSDFANFKHPVIELCDLHTKLQAGELPDRFHIKADPLQSFAQILHPILLRTQKSLSSKEAKDAEIFVHVLLAVWADSAGAVAAAAAEAAATKARAGAAPVATTSPAVSASTDKAAAPDAAAAEANPAGAGDDQSATVLGNQIDGSDSDDDLRNSLAQQQKEEDLRVRSFHNSSVASSGIGDNDLQAGAFAPPTRESDKPKLRPWTSEPADESALSGTESAGDDPDNMIMSFANSSSSDLDRSSPKEMTSAHGGLPPIDQEDVVDTGDSNVRKSVTVNQNSRSETRAGAIRRPPPSSMFNRPIAMPTFQPPKLNVSDSIDSSLGELAHPPSPMKRPAGIGESLESCTAVEDDIELIDDDLDMEMA